MCQRKKYQICVGLLVIATATLPGFAQTAPLPATEPALDAVYGPTSSRLWIKLSPVAAIRVQKPGGEDPQQVPLSRELQAQCAKWGVTAIRPAYPFPFQNPALAAQLGLDRVYILEVLPGTDTPRAVQTFQVPGGEVEQSGVDLIGELASFTPDDPEFTLQYGLHNIGQSICNPACVAGTPDADIDAPEAWDLYTGESGGVTIAFLDSGIFPHEEFSGRILPGINILAPDSPIGTLDTIGHGTHVTGIAAARGNNGIGLAGVHWGANILPVRISDAAGLLTALNVGNGLIWAADHGADVINMSLQIYGLPENLTFLEDAAAYAHGQGAVLVAASGNGPRKECSGTGQLCVTNAQCKACSGSGQLCVTNAQCPAGEICEPTGETCENVVAFPAKYATVIAVAGTTSRDQRLFISNSGPEVALCAPGESVWSVGTFGANLFQSGTSASSPFVSGAVALLKSHAPQLTNEEIRSVLTATADDLGPPGWDPEFGFGRLNLHTALLAVTDTDGDGVSDPDDNCVDVPNVDQTDGDADGAGDACDACPNDPNKIDPGVCGCGIADADADQDGTANCLDGCPTDANKTAPGQCGCHVIDTDADGDVAADCVDGCPNDPAKTLPGACGCGVLEGGDADHDGVADCVDQCPGVDDALFAPGCIGAIPTVSQWGFMVLALLLMTGAKLRFGNPATVIREI